MEISHKTHPARILLFNWTVIPLILIVSFYIILLVTWVSGHGFISSYGSDYVAMWSAGKLIDSGRFSDAYNLQSLTRIQYQLQVDLNKISGTTKFVTLPAPYLPVFLILFKYLSRFAAETSFWIWIVLNQIALIGYMFYFSKKTLKSLDGFRNELLLFILVLVPLPVFDNFVTGQMNVLLLICMGEFFRNAARKKIFLSGIWLGGLLLKPQLLVLILPYLFLEHEWKSIKGFLLSAGVLILTSYMLSGTDGMYSYLQLLSGWQNNNSVTAPDVMINWRMVGVYFDHFVGPPSGVIVAFFGTAATIGLLYLLIKRYRRVEETAHGMIIVGLISGTLAVTWHAHVHMAIVLLPLLVGTIMKNQLPRHIIVGWAVAAPLLWMTLGGIGIFAPEIIRSKVLDLIPTAFGPTGFLANLLVFIIVVRQSRRMITQT